MSVTASLAALLLAACAEGEKPPAKPAATVRVERVIDGDTVELTRFGKTRLVGVDAPEEGRCGDNAATRFTRRELEGEFVKYELGKEPKDRYNRTLAYLTRGDERIERATQAGLVVMGGAQRVPCRSRMGRMR